MELYGLYSDKQQCLMAISMRACNADDFSTDVEVSFTAWRGGSGLWITSNASEAEHICSEGATAYYNSSIESPTWDEDYFGKLRAVHISFRAKGYPSI
jgi:hypothetical protein